MTLDRRKIFADKPRDPRPIIKPEPPRFGCILFALVAFALVILANTSFILEPTVADVVRKLGDLQPSTQRAPSSGPLEVYVPPPPVAGAGARARSVGNPGSWVTSSDYPADALRGGMEGVVAFTLQIGSDGRANGCTVTAPSGWELLDSTTCDLMMRRARFRPARDAEGREMASTFSSRIRWEIPDS